MRCLFVLVRFFPAYEFWLLLLVVFVFFSAVATELFSHAACLLPALNAVVSLRTDTWLVVAFFLLVCDLRSGESACWMLLTDDFASVPLVEIRLHICTCIDFVYTRRMSELALMLLVYGTWVLTITIEHGHEHEHEHENIDRLFKINNC
jgi:hypothetical protein